MRLSCTVIEIVTMRPSGTVTEIWRLKDNEVTSLTFWGSRDVVGHVTIRLPGDQLPMGGP